MGIAVAQTDNYENGEYVGIAGIAGGWGSRKGVSAMLLATAESGTYDSSTDSTYLTSVVDCITYAMNNGANVINMSFGIKYTSGYEYVQAVIDTAVDEFNCVCIAAAGNSGGYVEFPASYSKTIAVGLVDSSGNYDGSCHGDELDVVAYTDVYTTKPDDEYGLLFWRGTSFAAPHVSGVAALILSINKSLCPSEVKTIITSSTDNAFSGWDEYTGWGRVNAYKSLKTTIEDYGGSGETFTFNQDVTIQAGDTLTIDPGSTVEFYPGKRLIVKGTLIADSITFTKYSTSNWGGISFDNASSNSVIENCTITNADTGIVLVNSDITIKNNEIYNNYYYGIYSYNSSPLIETNEIYNISGWYGMYAYNGNPTITDNYIHDISEEGIAINGSGSATYLRHNSIIDCEGGILLFGNNSVNLRGGSGTYGGYNTIEYYDDGPGTYGIKITGGEPNLGEYYPTACRGYNNFIYDGRDIVYNSTGSEIMAEKNYWGGSPQASWFTGSVAYDFPLSSPVTTAGSSFEKPVLLSDDRQLLVTASELLDAKSYAEATEVYKQLIEQYPYSFYASLALGRAMAAYRLENDLASQRSYLKGLTEHPNSKVVNKAILWLASIESWSGNRTDAEKIVTSTDIKDTLGIEIRLNWANDLVNVYNDTKSAEEVFAELLNSEPNEGTIATIEAIRATAPGFKTDQFFKEISQQDRMSLPAEYKLGSAYPNPFNPSTTIAFDIPESGQVNIQVYDITGRLVTSLLNDYKEAGRYKVIFDGTNLSSGLYIYRMMTNDFYSQKKMLLIK